MDMKTHVCIMAGGAGTRFWPMSTEEMPKQFIDVLDVGKSLLQLTYDRAIRLTSPDRIWIMTHEKYQSIVVSQLPDIKAENILLEPARRNTAPAIAYAANKIIAKDKDGIMVMLSSDHVILKEDAFVSDTQSGIQHVHSHNSIFTLGIQPTKPHTGYGYIQYEKASDSIKPVLRFVEKPGHDTAKAYLESGDYLWNAGIFIWKASRVMEDLKAHAPEIYQAFQPLSEAIGKPEEHDAVSKAFAITPSQSIDYAIMEHADDICTKPSDIGWSDLGTWGALYDMKRQGTKDNIVSPGAMIVMEDCENCLIRIPEGKQAIVKSLNHYVVAWQEGGLLIYPIQDEQKLKSSLSQLKDKPQQSSS